MLKQRLKDKVHPVEIIKWGLFDGALVGGFVVLFTILHEKRDQILALAGGWEFGASLLLIGFVSVAGIVTATFTFAHPLYSFFQKQYKDALLTIAVTVLIISAMTVVALWSRPLLQY